ncbi:DNAJ domain-containing protein [Pseudovirgaria hyperparasitica]|uniref:Tetratricopeptide repeat and J domain-containing co-chaperone DNJ1 n=1 Tax=Pseudovirgaria hyperparasitica TaxID=470096 RepID=A0A6A6W6C7_9PEZI|nr:DNAJ domain-containing protein [Pseudovirgaria hyperparasitica]KAF2758173.1 DNAJ domain-containing protein [Pseudovirgaria hyperparasitica]
MILSIAPIALGALVFSTVSALSPADIPVDTPISKLLESAHARFIAGDTHDALTYYDVAIARDPQNYMTIFRRATTYLSIGRNNMAQLDFDKVLSLKPNHEGALTQRAKIKSRNADWAGARADYRAAGKAEELSELESAEGAAILAEQAAKKGDWEACVSQAGVAILTAGTALDLRKLRARCRLERGEVMEGVSDLQHVLQISTGSVEPHLQISAMTFYSLGETEKGLTQIRKCLQSDPDSKQCMKLMKREKSIEKRLKTIRAQVDKRSYAAAVKQLIKSGDEVGLLQEVKDDVKDFKAQGYIHPMSPAGLYRNLVEITCEAYMEMNNRKRATPYCHEILAWDSTNIHAMLIKAHDHYDAEEWEPAINTLNDAAQHHPQNRKINELLGKAQKQLKISKQKDYYKVLGVSREADERQIKKAYRGLTKQFHPDKAATQGITKEDAEKKMASINEAYEVLSDPELKARFDNGDDPNNPEQQQGGPFQGSPFSGPGGQQFFFKQGGGGGMPFGGGGGGFKFQGGGFPGGFNFG